MSRERNPLGFDFCDLTIAHCAGFDVYVQELYFYLEGIVPEEDIVRFIEETADHLESLYEETPEDAYDGMEPMAFLAGEYGSPRQVSDDFIEAWFTKPSRLGALEKRIGPGAVQVLALFGMAALGYWILLQFRVFLPSNSAFHLPWSPSQIRRYFPEPLPFPDFSLQFLLMTGAPFVAPPLLGWVIGRIVHVRPYQAVYGVLMPMIVASYIIGILLLPITDGLIFAVIQTVYWLPVGCGTAYLSAALDRRARYKRVQKHLQMALGTGLHEVKESVA